MTAAEDIALVAGERPVVVDLARVLSLASHVDVALVRALRLAVFPESDVSTEADLWSSVLVAARGEGDLVLRGDVREALWDDLRADADLLEAHRDALSEVRTESPPLAELEERLTFHALAGDLAAIDRELRTVIAAMRDEPDRRRNLAAWSAQALDHLPAEVRSTEAARILGNVARSWVATPIQIAAMTPDVDSMEIVQSLQADTGARVAIYVRRLGDTLEVSTTPESLSVEIPDVPVNNPVLFVDHDQSWPLDLRGITTIAVEGPRIMLGTPDKRRWWLEPEQDQPNVNAIRTTSDDDDGVPHTVYLVAPDQVVTTARWLANNPRPIVSFGGWRPAELVAVDEEADIALVRLSEPLREPPLEFDPDVRQGQSWQAFPFGSRIVGTIATAWPGVTIRMPAGVTTPLPPGTPIFSGTKVIGHVSSEPPSDGIIHTISARLIQWWLAEVAKSHPPANEDSQDPAQHIMSAPNAFSPSMFSDAEESIDEQNTVEQNTVEQNTAPNAPDFPGESPRSKEAVATMPVVIELPARISTGGLLGTTLAQEGPTRRFRRHQWGGHLVTLVTDRQSFGAPMPHIRIRIRDVEIDPRTAAMEFAARLFRNPEKDAFYNSGTPMIGFSTEVNRGPRRGGTPGVYDLDLIVNRAQKVPPAHAYRRGVQFVLAVLDNVDRSIKSNFPGEPLRLDLHVPNCGELDLLDAQRRVRAVDEDFHVLWIDPETDLVELSVSTDGNYGNERLHALAAALGGEMKGIFGPAAEDRLSSRFGLAHERAGRRIAVTPGDPAHVSVAATDGSPVRGYVAFYATDADGRIVCHRMRAVEGVASCELARREDEYAVGAVIEDEGIVVESLIEPIDRDDYGSTGAEVA
jgi:hypothetical protein